MSRRCGERQRYRTTSTKEISGNSVAHINKIIIAASRSNAAAGIIAHAAIERNRAGRRRRVSLTLSS